MWLSVSIPTSFSEAIALQLRRPDFENPYLYTQIFSGAMFIAASMCMWLLRAWKLEANDLEEQAMLGSDGELQRKSKSEYSEKAAMPLSAMDKWKSRDVSKWVRFGIV